MWRTWEKVRFKPIQIRFRIPKLAPLVLREKNEPDPNQIWKLSFHGRNPTDVNAGVHLSFTPINHSEENTLTIGPISLASARLILSSGDVEVLEPGIPDDMIPLVNLEIK